MITNDLNELLSKIDGWGRARNIIGGGTSSAQAVKFLEEGGELAHGIARNDPIEIADSIGDVVVVLAMIAGIEGLDFAECVAGAWDEIKDRKGRLVDGIFIKEA